LEVDCYTVDYSRKRKHSALSNGEGRIFWCCN